MRRHDLSSLRHLASVGEPLNAEAVIWSQQAFGKPFHDTFWQTETGCIVITNFPGMPIKPGSMGKPFPGITATVLNTKTYEPITELGDCRTDRAASGLAVTGPRLLEQRSRLQGEIQERLVSVRRSRLHRCRWLFLVHGA